MATVIIERKTEDDISKFYLDSLESLQIKDLDDKCEDFTRFYYGVRDLINPNTHFTSLDKLGPSLLYVFLKTRGVLLVLPDFLDLYGEKYYDFTWNLKKVLRLYPEFNTRNKKSIIKKYVATILKSFRAEERIISLSLTLFDHFYPIVQYKKEEIVAAVICALTTISFDLTEITMRLICNRAGIRQSSLYKSITTKIFPYLGIPSSFKVKSSFELIKGKIRKKTSLLEIKVRTTEEEVVDLWGSGVSINKITELVEIPKHDVIVILNRNYGDYLNYRTRYGITQQEIDIACQLRKKGLGFREIASRIHRQLQLTKKIIEDNLEDYTSYKYIPHQYRVKYAKLVNPKVYMSSKLVVQFYYDLLRKINIERSQRIPLSKLAYLLLQHENRIKKNIVKTCHFLSEVNVIRSKKTVLGMVLTLSFPQIPHVHVANLVGVSAPTVRNNLTFDELKVENIAAHLDLVVKEHINLESVFDYLEIIVTLIRKGKIPQVEPQVLKRMIDEIQRVKINIYGITKLLTEKDRYQDEVLILVTAISVSCPSVDKKIIKQIITGSLNRKVKHEQVSWLQEILAHKTSVLDQISLMDTLGELLEERESDVLCAKCGNFVYLQIYPNNKKIFSCKHCLI